MANPNPASVNQKLFAKAFSVNNSKVSEKALVKGWSGYRRINQAPRQGCKNNKPHLAFSSYISWSRK